MGHVIKRALPLRVCLGVVLAVCLSGALCASVRDPHSKVSSKEDSKAASQELNDSAPKVATNTSNANITDVSPSNPAIEKLVEDLQKVPSSVPAKSRKTSKVIKEIKEKTQAFEENPSAFAPSLPLNATSNSQLHNDSDVQAAESQVAPNIAPLENALINSNPKDSQHLRDNETPSEAVVAPEADSAPSSPDSSTKAVENQTDGSTNPGSAIELTNVTNIDAPNSVNLNGTQVKSEVPADNAVPTIAQTSPPNLSAYKYLLKANVCPAQLPTERSITAIILVMSPLKNVDLRNNIRNAFPEKDVVGLGLRRVFVLASNETDGDSKLALRQESEAFSDIVQFNINETFADMPMTVLLGMKFAALNCKKARFFIKTEDNVLIDYYQIAQEFEAIQETDSDKIIGHVWRAMAPIRPDTNSNVNPKYITTIEEFSEDTFPVYVSGIFYAVSYQNVKKLLKASKKENYFKTDDVYVTGMLAKAAGISHLAINSKFTFKPNSLYCCSNEGTNTVYPCKYMIGYGHGTAAQIETAWFKIRGHTEYCYTNQNCTVLADGEFPSEGTICT